MCEIKLNERIAKNPKLIDFLNRSTFYPGIRKYCHIPYVGWNYKKYYLFYILRISTNTLCQRCQYNKETKYMLAMPIMRKAHIL